MSGPFRLICALLTLLLALPAMQANACAPGQSHHGAHSVTMSGQHHEHHGKAHTPAPAPEARHDCVGCIPPIDIGVYRPAAEPGLSFPLLGNVAEMQFDVLLRAPPEPPPPRMTV